MNTVGWLPPTLPGSLKQWVPFGATAWAQSCTCMYLAKISWGHMLGVRAEKGPLAEGMWFPKIKEDQE